MRGGRGVYVLTEKHWLYTQISLKLSRPVHQTYVKISPPNTKTDMRLVFSIRAFCCYIKYF